MYPTTSDALAKVKTELSEEQEQSSQLAHTCQGLRCEISQLQTSLLSLERQCETSSGVDKVFWILGFGCGV
jgi:septal ring factor EnvC (AmiA/AmiB activator)